MPRCSDHPVLAVIAGLHQPLVNDMGWRACPSMRILASHDQTLADAFKAAVITFPTAWLITGKRACKAGTRGTNRHGHKPARCSPSREAQFGSHRELWMPRRSAKSRRQFPLGATGFEPQGMAVMVQLL